MIEEEDRKIEELRIKKNNREYWEFLKGSEDREQKLEHELYVQNTISTDEKEQKRHIKEYWEKIGKLKGLDKRKNFRLMMKKRYITKEQNYTISSEDIKKTD